MCAKSKLYELSIKPTNIGFKQTQLKSPKDCYDFMRQFYGEDILIYESFFLLLLNNANKTIGYAKISQGGIVGTVVDIKIIAKYAIDSLATTVVLGHNHPSGNLKPSEVDLAITKKIVKALEIFDIRVLDHIILTELEYFSFADNGLI